MYVCVVWFVCVPSTVATFSIVSLLFKSFTVTLNSTVLVCPAFNVTLIPLDKFVDVYDVDEPPTLILPYTNDVPVGMLSFTITVAGAVPLLLSSVIVYVIISSFSTILPELGLAVLLNVTFGLLTIVCTWLVDVPSTVPVFVILFVYSYCSKSSTVTSKLNVDDPFAGTFTVIPFDKLVCVYHLVILFTFILPVTKVVPLGIVSFIITFFDVSPSFSTVIVYVSFCPSST